MERIIWLYWENKPGVSEPPHITLCRESVRRNSGARVVVVNQDNINDYLPDLPPAVNSVVDRKNKEEVAIALKTDFIRFFLLEKYGGLYLDSDAIVLNPLDEVFEAIEETGFACMRKVSRPRHRIPNNFIGSLPGNDIVTMFANHLRYEIGHRTVFDWGETGAKSLTPIVNGNLEHAAVFPEHRVHPIINNDQGKFAEQGLKSNEVLPEDALVCMLFHGIFDPKHSKQKGKLANHTVRDLYYGNTLLADIFRNAVPEDAVMQLGVQGPQEPRKAKGNRVLGIFPRRWFTKKV